MGRRSKTMLRTSEAKPNQVARPIPIPTLREIEESPDRYTSQLDIAALNLACAKGLPGADRMDSEKCFAWLDSANRPRFAIRRFAWNIIKTVDPCLSVRSGSKIPSIDLPVPGERFV